MSICAGFMFFTTLLSFALRTLLIWCNRKLDQQYSKEKVNEKEAIAVENYGPSFRFVL